MNTHLEGSSHHRAGYAARFTTASAVLGFMAGSAGGPGIRGTMQFPSRDLEESILQESYSAVGNIQIGLMKLRSARQKVRSCMSGSAQMSICFSAVALLDTQIGLLEHELGDMYKIIRTIESGS